MTTITEKFTLTAEQIAELLKSFCCHLEYCYERADDHHFSNEEIYFDADFDEYDFCSGTVVACGGYTVYDDPTGAYNDNYYVDIDSIEFTAERFDEETDTNYVYEADEQSLDALSQAIYKNCGRPRSMPIVPRREIARAKA
jgi:hypothetical protein